MNVNELTTAKTLLLHAKASAVWVAMLFHGAGDAATAARLNDIDHRLADEIQAIERMISAASKP